MKKAIKVLNGAKTAHVLASKLGLGRNWTTTLADFRRDRITYGPILLPVGVCRDSRMKRPLYALADIATFISEYLVFDPNARPFKLEAELYAVDTADLVRLWKHRSLVGIGASPPTIALMCVTAPVTARPAAPIRSPATRSLPPRSTKDFAEIVLDDDESMPVGLYAH